MPAEILERWGRIYWGGCADRAFIHVQRIGAGLVIFRQNPTKSRFIITMAKARFYKTRCNHSGSLAPQKLGFIVVWPAAYFIEVIITAFITERIDLLLQIIPVFLSLAEVFSKPDWPK